MRNEDNENEALVETIREREVGVEEVFRFYTEVEKVYSNSIRTLVEDPISIVTNNTNFG